MDSLCFWYSGSESLHALAIPPDEDENVSFPSMVSIISSLFFCFSLISFIRSLMITLYGCPFIFDCFNSIHCCFITVLFPIKSTAVFSGRYILNIVVLLLFSPI